MNFIKTQDTKVAEELRKAGFQEMSKEGNFFVFINNGKQQFSDNKKIIYTDKLCF